MTWACQQCGCSAPPRYHRCAACKKIIDELYVKEISFDDLPSGDMSDCDFEGRK